MKRIGIPGWVIDKSAFGVSVSYMEYVSRFGMPIILTPQHAENMPELDLLLLPGGADVLPMTYDAVPSYRTGNPNLMLEFFDEQMLPFYIENQTPIFGVCRGAQKLWSYFGGDMVQHNRSHAQSTYSTHEVHELKFEKPYAELSNLIKKVTSRHHQSMSVLGMTEEERSNFVLDVVAFSEEKVNIVSGPDLRVVEIFKHKTQKMWGVQYHPEDHSETDKLSVSIIEQLLEQD